MHLKTSKDNLLLSLVNHDENFNFIRFSAFPLHRLREMGSLIILSLDYLLYAVKSVKSARTMQILVFGAKTLNGFIHIFIPSTQL